VNVWRPHSMIALVTSELRHAGARLFADATMIELLVCPFCTQ
jgi:hypothetical protein